MRNPDNIDVLARVKVLVLSLYQSPLRERGRRAPGLSPQLLRAAGSIQWNIVEGAALEDPAFAHHLEIAIASANEAEHQLQLAYDLGLLGANGDWYLTEIVEVRKMTIGLRKAVIRRIKQLENRGVTHKPRLEETTRGVRHNTRQLKARGSSGEAPGRRPPT